MSFGGFVFQLQYLRYVLVLNVLASLFPASILKGREHDPLLNARWWPHQYHSAVLVVFMAALVGTGLAYVLLQRGIARWWAYCLSGSVAGTFPGLFYMVAMPRSDLAPGWLPLFAAMATVGFLGGALMGLITYAAVGRPQRLAGS